MDLPAKANIRVCTASVLVIGTQGYCVKRDFQEAGCSLCINVRKNATQKDAFHMFGILLLTDWLWRNKCENISVPETSFAMTHDVARLVHVKIARMDTSVNKLNMSSIQYLPSSKGVLLRYRHTNVGSLSCCLSVYKGSTRIGCTYIFT